MRIYLYLLAGITSALIGWNLGHFFLTDLGLLRLFPEVVLFPCIATSLAIGMVMHEIFISNPTRPKLSLRIAKVPVLIALGLGVLAGLISGGISQVLFLPQIDVPPAIVRTLGWLLIGSSVGLAEGLTWRWHSVEAGDPKRFWRRFTTSVVGASVASLVAALLFELVRSQTEQMSAGFKAAEDPIGFSILGLLLGLTFSITTSPSYMAALRAGSGFEYTGETYEDIDPRATITSLPYPTIDRTILTFVSDSEREHIEEGLSIQLPASGKLRIGSLQNKRAQIQLPGVPIHVADIDIKTREATLIPNPKAYQSIEISGENRPPGRLTSRDSVTLKHNYLLTFYPEDEFNDSKYYRFVYYNRFLDPQA